MLSFGTLALASWAYRMLASWQSRPLSNLGMVGLHSLTSMINHLCAVFCISTVMLAWKRFCGKFFSQYLGEIFFSDWHLSTSPQMAFLRAGMHQQTPLSLYYKTGTFINTNNYFHSSQQWGLSHCICRSSWSSLESCLTLSSLISHYYPWE